MVGGLFIIEVGSCDEVMCFVVMYFVVLLGEFVGWGIELIFMEFFLGWCWFGLGGVDVCGGGWLRCGCGL